MRQTWRRHTCIRCQAVYTTRELVDIEQSFRIVDNASTLRPFSRDILFLSIYECMSHRPDAVRESSDLTATIIAKLIAMHTLRIPTEIVKDVALQTLKQFNRAIATMYAARHQI